MSETSADQKDGCQMERHGNFKYCLNKWAEVNCLMHIKTQFQEGIILIDKYFHQRCSHMNNAGSWVKTRDSLSMSQFEEM